MIYAVVLAPPRVATSSSIGEHMTSKDLPFMLLISLLKLVTWGLEFWLALFLDNIKYSRATKLKVSMV